MSSVLYERKQEFQNFIYFSNNLRYSSGMQKFGIYIHFPFCLSKCPYCDFASKACRHFDEDILVNGYLRDLENAHKQPVSSIFFGGGTPSMLSAQSVDKVISFIAKNFTITLDAEITIEANPDAIDKHKMADFKNCGVNRLSLGVQALNDQDLKFLGRLHNLETALIRIEEMKSVFDNCSIDLIYARPNQTLEQWEKELDTALNFDLPHLSLYELSIEEGTPFYRKGITPCDDEVARELYLFTLDRTEKAGLPYYEVSNFAKKGFESRHNLLYWQGDDYLGIGPAAHGRIGLKATQNPVNVNEWLQKGTIAEELTPQERQEEKIMMGLRLREGITIEGIKEKNIKQALKNGWIENNPNRIIPTKEGILMLNQLTLLLVS